MVSFGVFKILMKIVSYFLPPIFRDTAWRLFYTFRLDAIIKEMDGTSLSPADLLANINASLYTLLEPVQFKTMLCAIIEPKNDRLVYAGAAAPEPIFGNVTTQNASLLDGSGILLGVRENST